MAKATYTGCEEIYTTGAYLIPFRANGKFYWMVSAFNEDAKTIYNGINVKPRTEAVNEADLIAQKGGK